MYMYHIFLIHSSVDGHLDCFHVLAIANSATVNTGVHVSFSMKVLSGYVPVKHALFYFFFLLFRTVPVAYGNSQTRG